MSTGVFTLVSRNSLTDFSIKHDTQFDPLCVSAYSGFARSFAFLLEERRSLYLKRETKVPKWAKVLFASKSARAAAFTRGRVSVQSDEREPDNIDYTAAHLCFPINSRNRASSSRTTTVLFRSFAHSLA
jgi:hypothetical protein